MNSPPFSIRVRIAATLSVLLCTAGCGAGFNSASLEVKPDSGSAQLGSLRINNVWVVVDPATGNAEVIGAVANTGRSPEQLVSVAAAGKPATVHPAAHAPNALPLPEGSVQVVGNTVTIAANSSVSFGQPGRPELEIPGAAFLPGRFTSVDLGFANAGHASVSTLIMPNTGLFENYDPNGVNAMTTPSPRAAAPALSVSPSLAPSPSRSPSPSKSASPSPSA